MTSLATWRSVIKYVSKPNSDAVKDIDISDILGHKYRYPINIGKDDIDPPLVCIIHPKRYEKSGNYRSERTINSL